MKKHFKCGEKPFQKRVEDMVKNLEALFKQEDSWTTKETIFCVVFCIAIGLILIYTGYSVVNWYSDTSDTQFEQCCCACGGQCYQQKSHKKPSLGTVLYKFFKGFVKEVPVYSWWICWYLWWCETMAVLSKNRTFIFFLTFLLLMPNVT